MEKFGPTLDGLIEKSLQLLDHFQSSGGEILSDEGLMKQIKRCIESETNAIRKQHLVNNLNDLRAYFYTPSTNLAEPSDGLVLVSSSADALSAYLTLTPPRGSGSIPTINKVMAAFNKLRIKHGIDIDAVELALKIIRDDSDIVWRILVARGEPPIPGKGKRIEYRIRVIDKTALRSSGHKFSSILDPLGEPVKEGDVIGRISPPERGIPGKTIFGEAIFPEKVEEIEIDIGEEIERSRDESLTALSQGYVVADANRVDIVPLYIMDKPSPGTSPDLSFPGAVFSRGDLQGPGSIRCEDLFVLGNCEQIQITSQGDVFIGGGILGHQQTSVDADGCVYSAFVSEARVSALGEIVVLNAIINSQVVSNDSVRVTSDKGIITGGTTQALKEIVAQSIGSEFGMLTETVVGKDFLTSQRMGDIREKIHLHENNLYRIQKLKQELAKSTVRIEDLPPEKQEIYIGVLRKEAQSQTELQSLMRRKKKLRQSLQDFLSASIQVVDSLYPPVRVQIVNEIKEIKEKLNAVTLKYDVYHGIVSSSPPNHKKD